MGFVLVLAGGRVSNTPMMSMRRPFKSRKMLVILGSSPQIMNMEKVITMYLLRTSELLMILLTDLLKNKKTSLKMTTQDHSNLKNW